MTTLSTAAWVAHDLAIATGVGGAFFGQVALEPALGTISNPQERGKVLNTAWRRFGNVQLAALGVVAATWFAGRSQLSGSEVGATSRGLVIAKDVFVLGALGSGAANGILGRKFAERRSNGAVPVDERGRAAPDAPASAKRLSAVIDVVGVFNLICSAGIVATTAVLAMQAAQSTRFSVVSRFLR